MRTPPRAVACGEEAGTADRDDLLASGVPRFLDGARYDVPQGRYARIRHRLARRSVSPRVPLEWILSAAQRRTAGSRTRRSADARRAPGLRSFASIAILDIESLGFLGQPLFLIGVLHLRRARGVATPGRRPGGSSPRRAAGRSSPRCTNTEPLFHAELVQYLARDYSEEEAVLRGFWRQSAKSRLWVTFNGRSFDLPFIRLRAQRHRLEPPEPRAHLDLLPVARRLWGAHLPDCRLQTLERRICGRLRTGGLPGPLIPGAYHAFVRTGEPYEMIEILRHNADDLLGLCDLFAHAVAAADART
ncbi:MAG: hypothetical protein GF330_09580 [Candidatus Eisenbacteria bacterium]|nr:hypothetical protein [Candidatus Eisenbacteria bacterium]